MVAHGQLAVSLYRQFGQSLSFAIPSGAHVELVESDVLLPGVALEDVVEPQRAVGEILVKVLCRGRCTQCQGEQSRHYMLHIHCLIRVSKP